MEYVNLGRSGLKVSRIALGCMSYGVEQRAWRLSEVDSLPFIRRALDLGINFFDTADMYGAGESEQVVGRALGQFARRDEVVIATKVFYAMRSGPNGGGLSRKAIFAGITAQGMMRRRCGSTAQADERVVNGLGEVAEARNMPRAQVALAWLMQKPDVTAPIVSATKLSHLDDAIAAMDVKLEPPEIALLERHYVPHAMSFSG
jgi:aryl-alcohol dehydrogenase-like predicted oxidoreductase